MENIAVLVNSGILYTAYGLTLCSFILLIKLTYNYFKTKDKCSAKRSLKITIIVTVIAFFLFYLIGLAGEYRKLDLSDKTARQLLNADITQIEYGEYDFEIINEDKGTEYFVSVSKYHGDTSLYDPPYYYREIERIFEHRITDEDSLVVVCARESDRDFKQIPIVQDHLTEVGIVQGNEVLEICFWDSENSDEILEKVLDYIFSGGLDNCKNID